MGKTRFPHHSFASFEVSPISDPLVTYLSDDLGGAQTAVQVLKAMRDQHEDPSFREFAGLLLPEIQADDGTLRSIAEKIGSGPSATKQVGGWLLENLVVKDNLKQRIVYSDSLAVLNVSKFAEAIEEEADPRPSATYHLG